MNFTWEGHTDKDGNWGLLPIKIEEGSNKTTTRKGGPEEGVFWGGVMGSIVNGDYMMSTVTWIWVYERYGLVDFISTSWQNTLLALTPKPLVGYTYIYTIYHALKKSISLIVLLLYFKSHFHTTKSLYM